MPSILPAQSPAVARRRPIRSGRRATVALPTIRLMLAPALLLASPALAEEIELSGGDQSHLSYTKNDFVVLQSSLATPMSRPLQ